MRNSRNFIKPQNQKYKQIAYSNKGPNRRFLRELLALLQNIISALSTVQMNVPTNQPDLQNLSKFKCLKIFSFALMLVCYIKMRVKSHRCRIRMASLIALTKTQAHTAKQVELLLTSGITWRCTNPPCFEFPI